jgi:hypothetical protein
MRKYIPVVTLSLLFVACSERQVARPLGIVRTAQESSVTADFQFVDSGRWTVFEFADRTGISEFPLPFHAQVLNADGKVVIEREVIDGPPYTSADGRRMLTWRVDTLAEPFEVNVDDKGLMPVDRVLKDGERYTLRLRFPAGVTAEYQVFHLENRHVYPWEHDD